MKKNRWNHGGSATIRRLPFRLVASVAFAFVLPYPRSAIAQTLDVAERALRRSDYEGATRAAMELVESGTAAPAELAAAYAIIGRAESERGNEDAARLAFVRALALKPDLTLERGLAATVRSRFLEARAVLADVSAPFDVMIEPGPDGTHLVVKPFDAAGMVARVRVRTRRAGETRFAEHVTPPVEQYRVPIGPTGGPVALEVLVTFLDEYGNRIWHRGDESSPLRLELQGPQRAASTVPPAREGGPEVAGPALSEQRRTSGAPWTTAAALVAGTVGVLAVAGGGVAHFIREDAAGRWNAADECTGEGITRGERCAAERATVRDMEVLAGIGYGVGGVALVSAVLLLVLGARAGPEGSAALPRNARASAPRCGVGVGAGNVSLACAGTF
jgi:hypothetical protein